MSDEPKVTRRRVSDSDIAVTHEALEAVAKMLDALMVSSLAYDRDKILSVHSGFQSGRLKMRVSIDFASSGVLGFALHAVDDDGAQYLVFDGDFNDTRAKLHVV